jgi:hypothetical protein
MTVGESMATNPSTDPLSRAIQIRARLRKSVHLITAAQWAKWRGGDPTSLGQYTRQRRLFAVRVAED